MNPALSPDLIYALTEEIGNPELFVGREQETRRLLDWAEGAKQRISKSMAILSRRKKGKTALLQRFWNILYTRGDPQLIPFYYRIPEERLTKTVFAEGFYRRLLTQYFASTLRRPELVDRVLPLREIRELAAADSHVADDVRAMEDILERVPGQAWTHARDAGHRISAARDVRIVQILDEFQYMNHWIRSDDVDTTELLCHSYMGTAESKVSPQIVAGSYIGWLEAILGHMTARYRRWRLGGLSDQDALAAVYNYARIHQVPISDEAAAHVAEICDNDPFYIAATVAHHSAEKDLTNEDGARRALAYETVTEQGEIADVWNEYIWDAFERVNDVNARKIVLYLASHEPEERGRDQILEDLQLEMTDQGLEKRLHKLVKADILARGSSNFRYRGLGDRIFAMVFRRMYGEEIERASHATIEADFLRELDTARRQAAWFKGMAAEHKVRYRLHLASLAGVHLRNLVTEESRSRLPSPEQKLDRFQTLRKARFHLNQEDSVEIDLHGRSEREDGMDVMVKVKAWQRELSEAAARTFIETKDQLDGHLKRQTLFLLYSEGGLGEKAAALLAPAGVLILDEAKLARCELPPSGKPDQG